MPTSNAKELIIKITSKEDDKGFDAVKQSLKDLKMQQGELMRSLTAQDNQYNRDKSQQHNAMIRSLIAQDEKYKAHQKQLNEDLKKYDRDRLEATRRNAQINRQHVQEQKTFTGQNTTLTSLNALKQQQSALQQFYGTLAKGDVQLATTKAKINSLQVEIDKLSLSSKNSAVAFGSFQNVLMGGGLIAGLLTFKNIVTDLIAEANKLQAATLGLESIAKFKGVSPQVAVDAVKSLELVKNGLLTVGDASLALKNLLASNFTLEQSIELIKRFGDAAAFGRQAGLEFGYAITSATEGIKNGNSILVDNAGVTKNLSVILTEAGFSAQDVNKATSDLNIRMALYNGLLKETNAFLGDANKLTNTFAGEQAKLDAQVTVAKQNLGIGFQQVLIEYLKTMTGAGASTEEFAKAMRDLPRLLIAASSPFVAMISLLNEATVALLKMTEGWGSFGIAVSATLNPLGALYDLIYQISRLGDPTEAKLKYAPTDSDLNAPVNQLNGFITPNHTKKFASEGFDLTKDKKGRTKADTTTKDFLFSLQEEIELRKLLKTLTFDFLKTKENELRSQLAITAADKDRLKILKEINSVISEQTDFVNKLIEVQKNQATRLSPADSSFRFGDAERTNRGILDNAVSVSANPTTENEIVSKFLEGWNQIQSISSGVLSDTQNIFNIIGIGTQTFASQLLNAFQNVVSLASSFVNILASFSGGGGGGLLGSILGGVVSFLPIPGAGLAGQALGGRGNPDFSRFNGGRAGMGGGMHVSFGEIKGVVRGEDIYVSATAYKTGLNERRF